MRYYSLLKYNLMLRVKELCALQGITLATLATTIGISAPSLSSAINGNPTLEMLKKIANALNVSISELFESNTDGFTALIDNNGDLQHFNSLEGLKSYIQSIESIK